jgi:elongation factor P
MDNESFEQHALPVEQVEDQMRFILEGMPINLLYWNGQLISITPPQNVVLEVTYTEPAARGDTATNVTKPATLETGAVVQVPAFIAQGNKIKIKADTGEYLERVQS